jgi:hypothetical protein
MSGRAGGDCGRLRRGSIWTNLKVKVTPHDTPGLAIPSIVRGFNLDGHRDSSLYRDARMPRNV